MKRDDRCIVKEFVDLFKDYFGDKMEIVDIRDFTDGDCVKFTIDFLMYKYIDIKLEYDRGIFSCSIINSKSYIQLKSSQDFYERANMKLFFKEIDQQIRLRIPDKFLTHYEWN